MESTKNHIFVSLQSKDFHTLYCVRIPYPMEIFGKIIKTIHHNGFDTWDRFILNGKEIISLKKLDFVEGTMKYIFKD